MKTSFLSSAVAVTLMFLGASSIQAGVVSLPTMATTNVSMDAVGDDVSNLIPGVGPPLLDIRVFDSPSAAVTGIYTNQVSGVAGVAGGIRTVVGGVIASATDGVTYTGLESAAGTDKALGVFLGLEGSFVGPGSVSFTGGAMLVYELASGLFNPRDPSTWLTGATLLESFPLALAAVVPGSVGLNIVPVPVSNMNLSVLDGLTVGDTDFQFLFADQTDTGSTSGNSFLYDYVSYGGSPDEQGVHLEGEQDIRFEGTGTDTNNAALGGELDGADLATLNSIAALAGLTDLGGASTAFATALGASSVMSTDFFMDPNGLQTGTGSGDLFARANEANFYPVATVPEPASIAIFAVAALGMGAARRRKNRVATA